MILITGVHNTPALAVLQELRKNGHKDFLWVGQRKTMIGAKGKSIEFDICQKHKIPFQNIFAGKRRQGFSLVSLIWWLKIPFGFLHAFAILLRHRPEVIVTFGSHVGVPIAYIGKLFGIKILHHQQPIVMGLSDEQIQKHADIACYAWKASEKYFPKNWSDKKYRFTGNPVREGILNPKTEPIRFGKKNNPVLLVVGGNQGAHVINKAIFDGIRSLTKKYNIIHQVGKSTITNDLEHAQSLERDLNKNGEVYAVKEYLYEDEMGSVLRQADIVVSRSGANFCYEFATLGVKCILIPIPWATRNEQMLNARALEKTGLATIIKQGELSYSQLAKEIDVRLGEARAVAETAKKNAKALVKPDAAKNIVDEIEILIGE